MASVFYRKYNLELRTFASDWNKMFEEIPEVQHTFQWLTNIITTYGPDTNEIFNVFKVNLDKCYDNIHSEDPTVFERDDVILFQKFQFKQLFPRLSKREKQILWNKLKTISSQNGVATVVGSRTKEFEQLVDVMKAQGKTTEELRQTLGKDFLLNEGLRGKMLDLLFGAVDETENKDNKGDSKNEKSNDMMQTLSNLGPMLRSLGFVSSKTETEEAEEHKAEEDKEEDNDENKDKEEKDKEEDQKTDTEKSKPEEVQQKETQQSASMLYLSRKKRLAKLRKQQKKEKGPKKNIIMDQIASMLENVEQTMKDENGNSTFDKKQIRKEMEEMFASPENRELFTKFTSQIKTTADLPQALAGMMAHLGENGNEEMKQQLEQFKGMKLEDMQQMCMDQLRNLPKK